MIKTSLAHTNPVSLSSGDLTNNWPVADDRAETQSPRGDIKLIAAQSLTHGHSVDPTGPRADLPLLGKRQCAWLDQVNHRHITPGRAQWGGKGMYLMVLSDVGLMVPLFCCLPWKMATNLVRSGALWPWFGT